MDIKKIDNIFFLHMLYNENNIRIIPDHEETDDHGGEAVPACFNSILWGCLGLLHVPAPRWSWCLYSKLK
jgi:hypothetical protein